MEEKDLLYIQRKRKGILLREIAEYIPCSVAALSLYENNKCNLEINKAIKYKEYILSR